MTTTNNLTAERIAEIKAFKTTDFSDCPIQTAEELAEFKPKHPEYFKPMKKAVQLRGIKTEARRTARCQPLFPNAQQ
jgi:hypothetical protein